MGADEARNTGDEDDFCVHVGFNFCANLKQKERLRGSFLHQLKIDVVSKSKNQIKMKKTKRIFSRGKMKAETSVFFCGKKNETEQQFFHEMKFETGFRLSQ